MPSFPVFFFCVYILPGIISYFFIKYGLDFCELKQTHRRTPIDVATEPVSNIAVAVGAVIIVPICFLVSLIDKRK